MPALARSAADFLPARKTLASLRKAAAGCRGCDLYKDATQTVFGEGPARAAALFVGEQPGDREDREGHPFVGPAGALLRNAMDAAGIAPADVYITNAVKHFKFVWRGKRRIHATPKRIEVRACEPWLFEEIKAVKPRLVVALGATAAQALLGPSFRLTQHRGEVVASPYAPRVVATVHPSSILRAIDEDARRVEMAAFVDDLGVVARLLKEPAEAPRA
ncbi:MAG TPA: UdgX family uracil-DNA binding protein [Candidatus Elarobacter sp.]|nr:UdgX family uracil-DNA binding protein [Candidatus Elarobacter sp.]